MQVWLPASLSVIPNTAFLRRVSTPLADVTAWYSPRFRAGRDEMSACVKSIHHGQLGNVRESRASEQKGTAARSFYGVSRV